ncbi:flavin monoamine oxidase family protein [Arthrobacter russicus]|uniref:Putrescine oxidase n=1 Tax=Arthrobacter russicus TaxID=172040 RepID=A0ABU1J8P5_9MICC|nr:NAD(P)/FAD-dependent oxidoreductase [Arthrobacter russicus]MDR6268794.1 putrescine oxidase [Arthrobacter russicus]
MKANVAIEKFEITELNVDVVVVGAGPAGLMAARTLTGAGLEVAVVEARDRVGGRTWSKTVDGAFLEVGGQWISPNHKVLKELLPELGLKEFPLYGEGDGVYLDEDGTRHVYSGENFPISEQSQQEMNRLIGVLDELSSEIDPDAPWTHPQAHELDTISFQSWLETKSDDALARDLLTRLVPVAWLTKPAHDFSALQAMQFAASAGVFSAFLADNIVESRVVGGMQSVSEKLAKQLPDPVLLGAPAQALSWEDDSVVVEADGTDGSKNYRIRARRAIVAVPPNLYDRISYSPPLPAIKQQLMQHLSMGLVIKAHVVYDRPFWRDAGLSGAGTGLGELVKDVLDNSNYQDPKGTLVGFIGDEAVEPLLRLPAEERREKILNSIANYLGPEALEPEVYYESDWASEEWTRGAYGTSFDIGGLSRFGVDLRTPIGPIHWASSDLAGPSFQHVDGALRVGKSVAEEIIAELDATD